MNNKTAGLNPIGGLDAIANPSQCLMDIVDAWSEYVKIVEEEKTKRCEIEAQGNIRLAEINEKRDLLIGYLDRSFDERSQNFQSLFQAVDLAIGSGDDRQLSLVLHAIVELARSSPFKDLADLSTVKAALDDPNHVWTF